MPETQPSVGTVDLGSVRFEIEQHIAEPMSAAHWHDHVELNLLLSGEMSYLFNGRQERVEAGHLVLFWAAIPHRTIEVESGSPLICIYLPLAEMLSLPIERDAKQAIMQGSFLVAAEPSDLDIALARRWLADWTSGSDSLRRIVVEEVSLRVRRMLRAPLAVRPAPRRGVGNLGQSHVRRAEELIELINRHYAEPLSVTRLASMAGVHPSTAAAAFRSVLGISLNEYIIRYRLAQVMHRLADTNDPILDIAFSSGFGSTSRFYDVSGGGRAGLLPSFATLWGQRVSRGHQIRS